MTSAEIFKIFRKTLAMKSFSVELQDWTLDTLLKEELYRRCFVTSLKNFSEHFFNRIFVNSHFYFCFSISKRFRWISWSPELNPRNPKKFSAEERLPYARVILNIMIKSVLKKGNRLYEKYVSTI